MLSGDPSFVPVQQLCPWSVNGPHLISGHYLLQHKVDQTLINKESQLCDMSGSMQGEHNQMAEDNDDVGMLIQQCPVST